MKPCKPLFATALAIVFLTANVSLAEDKSVLDAQSGFEKLKTLTGTWVNVENADDDSRGVEFSITAAGSAVTAIFYPGSAMEMVSVFHLDGPDQLVHTHYCALQNQPTMRLVKTDNPGELRFEFAGGANIDVDKDLHVHHTTIRFLDSGRVENVVEAWNGGKQADVNTFVLARKEEPSEEAAAEPKSHYFTASDGVKIHYLTLGDHGSPVVLIHGYTGTAEGNWFLNGVAQALAQNHRVVAIDCRGHGKSDKPHDSDKYGPQMAKDVFELMDHLGIEKAHIHGYSMGGFITSRLMAMNPERFITAAFGGSGVRETDPEQQAKVREDAEGPDPQEAEARQTLGTAPHRDEKALAAVRGAFRSIAPKDLDLTGIEFPVLAINGEYDRPNARTHRMQRELANFKSVVLPGKSHLTAIMSGYMPQQYVDSLVEFVNANDVAE